MKYALLLFLLLGSCTSKNEDLNQIDKDLKEIRQNTKEIERQLRVVDCEMGLLIAIDHFKNLLYKKVTKEQFDAAFKECQDIGK